MRTRDPELRTRLGRTWNRAVRNDAAWLRERYDEKNRANIRQHIRFAQYWYSANGCLTDLQEYCSNIAKEAGLKLSPSQAWQWLSQGGFAVQEVGLPTFGTFDIASAKQLLQIFDSEGRKAELLTDGYNVFKLNLHGASKERIGALRDGRIHSLPCWVKGGKRLPCVGLYELLLACLRENGLVE